MILILYRPLAPLGLGVCWYRDKCAEHQQGYKSCTWQISCCSSACVFEEHLAAKASTTVLGGATTVKGNKFTAGMIGSWNANVRLEFATMAGILHFDWSLLGRMALYSKGSCH
jgi:hypothetical protein